MVGKIFMTDKCRFFLNVNGYLMVKICFVICGGVIKYK